MIIINNPFIGSSEEVEDLKTAYSETGGLIGEIMNHVPHSTDDDEHRFIIIKFLFGNTLEQVLEVSIPATFSGPQVKRLIGPSSPVVSMSPLLIAQYCVHETDLLELERRVRFRTFASIGVLVGMVYECETTISFPDIFCSRFMVHIQDIVQVDGFRVGKEL